MTDEIGKQLGPEYVDIRPMSEGGMGTLFQAHRLGLDVDVVIKRVKQKYVGKLDQRAEANILKRLKHSYLPRIYDIIQGSDGYVYTVMDLIPGQDMNQYVKRSGPVDQRTAHRWACQLCEVVAYLHSQNPMIIHRDIKPSNVMITPEGNVCLIDFNTSFTYENNKLVNALTDGFAAPEQYLPRPVAAPTTQELPATEILPTEILPTEILPNECPPTEYLPQTVASSASLQSTSGENLSSHDSGRSSKAALSTRAGGYGGISKCTDVYGIGATLYFLASGRIPEKALDPVTPLSSLSLPLSTTFVSIIERAMEKSPARRFPDAAHMLAALQDVDLLDARYRHFHLARVITRTVFSLLFCVSAICAGYGALRLYQGRQNNYLNLVTQSQRLSDQGDLQGALTLLQQAIQMSPDQADAYLQMGVELYRQGQYQQALDLLDNAAAAGNLSPESLPDNQAGDFYYIRANCLYELSDYAGAVDQYRQALAHRQDNNAYYRGLAMAQARSGDLDSAQQTLVTLQDRGAASVDCTVVSAEIHAAQGQYSQALEEYRAVLQQTEDQQTLSRVYLSAAQAARQMGDLDGSVNLLREAAQRLGTAATLHTEMLAEVLSEKAQADPAGSQACYQEAEDCLKTVIDRGQGTELTSLNLAVIQQNLGEFERAEQTLLPLCQQYSTDYRPYMRLAFLYADWQAQAPVGARDYSQVQQYAVLAEEYYRQAEANGATDMEMTRLDALMEQLEAGGWLN